MELTHEFWTLVFVGFAAQMVDGALGMAYGLSASAFLSTLGHPPALVSATVHAAEVVTTGVSGISHAYFRNLDRRLFFKLVVPGVIAGSFGAYVLSNVPGERIRPFIWIYLLGAGLLVLRRAFRKFEHELARTPGFALGGAAGFLDAIGGGGWGTIATPTLIAQGHRPRYAIGTSNTAEFFVALSVAITFFFSYDWRRFDLVLALLLGGVVAAPVAAYVTKHIAPRLAMILVGLAVTGLAANGLLRLLLRAA